MIVTPGDCLLLWQLHLPATNTPMLIAFPVAIVACRHFLSVAVPHQLKGVGSGTIPPSVPPQSSLQMPQDRTKLTVRMWPLNDFSLQAAAGEWDSICVWLFSSPRLSNFNLVNGVSCCRCGRFWDASTCPEIENQLTRSGNYYFFIDELPIPIARF